MTLTKSEYIMYLKHPALLWLKKYDKAKIPPVDANLQAKFDTGNKLEAYALQLFPDCKILGFNSYAEYLTLGKRTTDAIKSGEKILYQARFDADELTCLTDIIQFNGPKNLNLYEVKSSTKPKIEHEFDLAFQVAVLTRCGFIVDKVSVVYVNTDYIRAGNIDSKGLFKISDLTVEVMARVDATEGHIAHAKKVISDRRMPDPSPSRCRMGSLKEWLPIYRTLVTIPENSIYDLASASSPLLAELEERGITKLMNIPDDIILSDRQSLQVHVVKSGEPLINQEKIKEFLASLRYPLYFYDYETCSDVIPPYDGIKPYQQVAIQYSIHILDTPNSELRHVEFIQKTGESPVENLANAIMRDMPQGGTCLVWYANFETSRNKEMAELYPDAADYFTDLNKRTVDLMIPFSEGWYVDSAFRGSASIKKVLPAFIPELSYKDLVVQDGLTAQRLWMQAVLESKGTEKEREELFSSLLSYCKLDTLAMVRIFQKLQQLVA